MTIVLAASAGIELITVQGGGGVTVQGATGTNLGATATINFASSGQEIWLVGTLNTNLAVTASNMVAGSRGLLLLTQDGTGSRTLTVNGTNVTITSTASALSVVEIKCPDATTPDVAVLGAAGPAFFGGVFGDGSDGALVYDGTTTILGMGPSSGVYTLTRDIYATTITVNNGVTIIPNGWRIFCTGDFTIAATGILTQPGTAGAANGTAGGGSNSGTIIGGQPGGAGNTTAGSNGTVGTVGTSGAGGLGSGGAAGTSAVGRLANSTQVKAVFASPVDALSGQFLFGGTTTRVVSGGSGGGGGGGDTTNKGGGGGSGGGPIIVFCGGAFTNNGTISSVGGNGGTPTTGNCGGGGGGSGGLVLVYYRTAATAGTITLTGGTHGNLIGTGANGVDGGVGLALVQQLV